MNFHLSLHKPSGSAGYALPLIIVLSGAFLVIGLSVLQAVTSLRVTLDDQYKTSLAREAGEAGIAYAKSCLQKTNYVAGWTTASPLMQNTDCSGNVKNGTTLAFLPDKVLDNNRVRTSFVVGALVNQDSVSQTIQATGQVYVQSGGIWPATPTYTQDFQQQVKRTNYGNNTFTYRSRGACSINNNTVECRGLNDNGQVGNGTISNAILPNGPIALPGSASNPTVPNDSLVGKKITKVDGGAYHVCMLADGKIYCWGIDGYGQLGDGGTASNGLPRRVVGTGNQLLNQTITDLQVFNDTTCVIAKNVDPQTHPTAATLATLTGQLYCWGENRYGEVGNGATGTGNGLPVWSCWYDWGLNWPWGAWVCGWSNPDADPNNRVFAPTPVQGLPAGYDAVSLSTGGGGNNFVCAIINANNTSPSGKTSEAWCWGDNGYGQLGTGDMVGRNTATRVVGLIAGKKILTISAEGLVIGANYTFGVAIVPIAGHTCAITSDDLKAYCWGSNRFGELGQGSSMRENGTSADCGPLTVCFTAHPWPLSVDGSWSGNPAVGSSALRNKAVTDIAAGVYHTCALANGAPYCWGSNDCGQLGTNTATSNCSTANFPGYTSYAAANAVDVATNVAVTPTYTNTRFSSLAGAGWTTCLVVGQNNVACWGKNDYYEQGTATSSNTNAPTASTYIKPLFPDYAY